jgi:phosphatidate cytidylyltransferase
VIAAFLLSFFYAMVVAKMGAPVTMRYAVILPAAAVLSLISVFGDLSCSLIKRQYGIKDYGTIFPGHGGVMDRFDSVLMVAPFVLFGMKLLPVVLPV